MSRKQSSWLRLSFDFWRVGVEAQQVVALRLAKLARGGASATNEATRMGFEKIVTAAEAQRAAAAALLTGKAAQIPARTVALYRRKVRANRRRLRQRS
jgi:hypothetical protein